MAIKIMQTCDKCGKDIEDYHESRSIAFINGDSLTFYAWNEKRAKEPKILHFHDEFCAKDYLANWLQGQRSKEVSAAPSNMVDEHAPQPARAKVAGWVETVQESDSAVVDAEYAEVEEPKIVDGKVVACNCWRNGDPFAAPETHAAWCPESLVSRRREVEAKETKPYAEAQSVEHPSEEPL